MQKLNADTEKKRSFTAVLHPQGEEARRPGRPRPADRLHRGRPQDASGQNGNPYRQLSSWDQGYADVYLVNLADGTRKKVLEKFPGNASLSPGGQYLSYYDQATRAWFSYRVADGKTFNLTSKLSVKFHREDWDSPSEPSAHGSAGWTDGDKALLLYDEYDIWEVKPDGSGARNVTQGVGRRERLGLPLPAARPR